MKQKKMSQEKELELRSEIKKRMQELSEYDSRSYDYVKEQLEFKDGDQWEEAVKAERDADGRPSVVLNLTKSYVNRVVNPLRMNPIGIRCSVDNPDLSELITSVIRDVEAQSRAAEAYETAYENAVGGGLGWIKVGTDYEDDESLEQRVMIDIVPSPTAVWLDPYAKRIDGSDARYGVCIDYMNRDDAREMYGDEACGEGPFGMDIYEHWNVPSDSVADITYYRLESEEVERFWLEDGTTVDGANPEEIIYEARRKVQKKFCRALRFVGNKLIDDIQIPLPYVPLIPVYGDRLHLDSGDNIHYAGVPHWLMDSQRMVNYYGSNELELAGLAPKAPFIAAEGQIEGYEEEWETANRRAHSVLPYKPETIAGQLLPPPQRADNQAQTQGLMASRQQAQADMGREIGIFDNMMGQVQAANETGKAALLRSSQGELPTAHYLQNLEQSIAQVGRVVLYMLAWVGDTPRMIGTRDDRGNRVMIETTLSEILTPAVLKNIEVATHAGPAYESKRRDSINAILQIGQIMPDKMAAMADLLVRNMDAPGSQEIADRLEKLLPPELQENGDGPTREELEAQLQQSQQTIAMQNDQLQKFEGVIRQLQAKILSNDKDRQADLAKTLIKEEGSLARERIKQAAEDERMAVKIEAEAESDMRKIAADVLQAEAEVDANLTAGMEATDYVPQVEGPVSIDEEPAKTQMEENSKTLGE